MTLKQQVQHDVGL